MRIRQLLLAVLVVALALGAPAADRLSAAVRSAAPDSSPLLLAAGDIATCKLHNDSQTAKLIAKFPGSAVAALGDNAYPKGSPGNYDRCYAPTWGAFVKQTRPAPGNHDYLVRGARGYYGYFGTSAGDPSQGYYSYDLGSWHVIVLNSNCAFVSCAAGSPQELWLQADLATHPVACTLAYWHHPLYSSSVAATPAVRPFWVDLLVAHADLVLNGHAHMYERFAPQNADGGADPNGIREIVVGTGGGELQNAGTPAPNSEVLNNTTFGVLKLTLREGGYDWQFLPIAGESFTDSGSGVCH